MKASQLLRFATLSLLLAPLASMAEEITILHVGDQESWLLSAQGNLRDNASQAISFYGGIDRLATVMSASATAATTAGRFVIKLNAGDSFLPGPRLNASFANLATAHPDGGQDFYDAIAMRQIGFDACVFGNHEFDLGPEIAARFATASHTTYLSLNLNLTGTPAFAALAAANKIGGSKIILTPNGKKIGIIGVTTPLLAGISSPCAINLTAGYNAASTELQNLQALLSTVQQEINDLRTINGASLIIVMSHLQNSNNERTVLVPGLSGVDLVLSGGGHELMTDPDDLLIAGGIAPSFTTHPIYANDLTSKATPILTSHFGNRYVGELNLTTSNATGLLTAIGTSKMRRVSGAAADADKVTGNAALNASVIVPVQNYINVLNAQVIGTTAVTLNGPTHVAGTPGAYTEGVRNAETGLGNLVADAMRFAGYAEVAIQNGGGIRASIGVAGNLSVGDTFNILTFTNLVKRAPAVNATQLKDLLEHAVGAASPSGAVNGRFAQISGMRVTYNSSLAARSSVGPTVVPSVAGSRIRRVVLDDGTVLIDNGVVVNTTRTFSFATIDFTANGGDNSPFPLNNVVFENAVNTINYQEALADFIETAKSQGGLQRVIAADGDEVTANLYGKENAFDLHGRLVDLAVGVAAPGMAFPGTVGRDTLTGSLADNTLTGGAGSDVLTGGAGGDIFVYSSIRDAGDTITDFTPYADKIDVSLLLASLGYTGSNATADGFLRVVDIVGGISLQYDRDGSAGSTIPRPLATLRGLTAAQFVPARDLLP